MEPGARRAGGVLSPGVPAELDEAIGLVLERLRTPLTAIKGWNQLARRQLRRGAAAGDVEPLLARTSQAVVDMQEAIDMIAAEHRTGSRLPTTSPKTKLDEKTHREPVSPPAARRAWNSLAHG